MGDLVACKAVLVRNVDRSRGDHLYLAVPPDNHLRIIPCAPKGLKTDERQWEYEEIDGRLHLTPSLLATDTGFHTDYNWSCDFVSIDDDSGYRKFFELNETLRPENWQDW